MILGAHESVAGGLANAVDRAAGDGCAAFQVFTKNANQWAARPIDPAARRAFRAAVAARGFETMAHDCYLINLGTADPVVFSKSVDAFAEELRRCRALGIPRLVMHPGAPLDAGEAYGLSRIAEGLDLAYARARVRGVRTLLETTAGQGSHLGWRFEHLREILLRARCASRLGVCFDTCHVFAAGYDFTTPEGYARVWEEFDRVVGLGRLEAFHLNDSKKPLGSRVDRHEILGQGCLGVEPFRMLVNDRRFARVPAVLETPPLPDGSNSFAEGIRLLRSLVLPNARRSAASKRATASQREGLRAVASR
jgi:deoxyribonuclease-4